RPAAAYIGMIGSKNKIAYVYEEAEKHGFDKEELEKVHAPIGLKIGGDNPQEIAVSIMAEIISVYSKKKHTSTVDIPFLEMLTRQTEGVLCRIISKSGSGPRSVGTQMLVTKSGIEGTIGGGSLETSVIEDARKLTEERMIKHYGLNSSDLGMACGGEVDILFTKLD
nr:XdhC family protein [Sphaerochaetaceae bacterium]